MKRGCPKEGSRRKKHSLEGGTGGFVRGRWRNVSATRRRKNREASVVQEEHPVEGGRRGGVVG